VSRRCLGGHRRAGDGGVAVGIAGQVGGRIVHVGQGVHPPGHPLPGWPGTAAAGPGPAPPATHRRGLYLDPPEQAVVLCVDEISQNQALDRTAPILPVRPRLPERPPTTRSGTAPRTLYAALEVATDKVTDACYSRHRSDEFLRFLKQVAKTHPRGWSCTSWSTTTSPTNTPGQSLAGWPATGGSCCTSPRLRIPG
jgi:hypothetical protein